MMKVRVSPLRWDGSVPAPVLPPGSDTADELVRLIERHFRMEMNLNWGTQNIRSRVARYLADVPTSSANVPTSAVIL